MNPETGSGLSISRNQHVLVMGLARSGEAVAQLLLTRGLSVTINEVKPRPEGDESIQALERLGAVAVFGSHPLELLGGGETGLPSIDYIVKNPGIPYTVPLIMEAIARGIPIYTEIEVASWLAQSPIYAITGSNGKTTTTTLVGQILSAASMHPVVAGNIGTPFSAVVESLPPDSPVVLEVSSFQLIGISNFHPKIAAFLNVYSAHLDYHGSIEEYVAAKMNLFRNMDASDFAVLNYDNAWVRGAESEVAAKVVWFTRSPNPSFTHGAYVKDGMLMMVKDGVHQAIIAESELALKGSHNVENLLAALLITELAGAPLEVIVNQLKSFHGVEHRTEFVASVNGVDYYNDSKATNAQAALGALRGFSNPIVWIAGGLNRGVDFHELVDDLKSRVKAAVLLGESADVLKTVCLQAGVPTISCVSSLEDAVQVAASYASTGDVVLLSPACASWDMFSSFEARGGMFKDAVHRL